MLEFIIPAAKYQLSLFELIFIIPDINLWPQGNSHVFDNRHYAEFGERNLLQELMYRVETSQVISSY